MWRTQLNRSIQEVRFVLKNSPEHMGVWRFVTQKLETVRMLNKNTFFAITEMNEHFQTKSAVHVIFGDSENTEHEIESENLSMADFEKILKEKVAYGLTLTREVHTSNEHREIPIDITEARSTVRYMDDRV